MVSKIEHGMRTMPEALWKIADEVCRAEGALVTEHQALAEAGQDYRAQCQAHQRQVRQSQAQAQVEALKASPVPSQGMDSLAEQGIWPGVTGVDGQLAEELLRVVRKLVKSVGRRQAIRLVGYVLAAVGLLDLDAEECARLAQAVEAPCRVDAKVVNNLAVMLAQCKRLEDKLGPCEGLVRRRLGPPSRVVALVLSLR